MEFIHKTALFCLILMAAASCNRNTMIEDIPYDPVYNFASNACPYHALSGVDTPAPKGYKPFYMSHYGRHGSRFSTLSTSIDSFIDLLEKEKKDSNLTAMGCELLDSLKSQAAFSTDKYGQLTTLGAKEHYIIASRMYQRFPEIWKKGGKIRAVASLHGQRCIISMANAALALKSYVPSLEFEMLSGDAGYKEIVGNGGYSSQIKKAASDSVKVAIEKNFPDGSPLKGIFVETKDYLSEAGMGNALYNIWKTNGCLDHPFFDIRRYMGEEDLAKLNIISSNYLYYYCGTNKEFGENRLIPAKIVLKTIISQADDAISGKSGRCADLRYSHDTASIPLYCAMGLEGHTAIPSFSNVWDTWKNQDMMAMGTNMQMVFFRKKNCGRILVKFLYCEKEITIPALQSVSGPYYDWQDVKTYWEGKI